MSRGTGASPSPLPCLPRNISRRYTRHENGPTGAQIGQDFLALQTLVREKFGSWQDPPLLLGPDVCGPGELTDDHPCADYQFFWALVTGGEAALDGVTIHHYGTPPYASNAGGMVEGLGSDSPVCRQA